MMKKIVVLFFISFLLCSCNENESILDKKNGKVVSCSDVEVILDEREDAVILDVRTSKEYSSGHLDGALNIPLDSLYKNIGILNLESDTPIIVYCRSGSRSAEALKILKDNGYTHVFDLGAMKKCY